MSRAKYPTNSPCPVHGLPYNGRLGGMGGHQALSRCGNHCGLNDMAGAVPSDAHCHVCICADPGHPGPCEFTGTCGRNA